MKLGGRRLAPNFDIITKTRSIIRRITDDEDLGGDESSCLGHAAMV
ncbi:hypothetical protein [Acidithrix ferrooxidans]|nr:hypothetical protein [Acidithrix ferrooxidans]